MYKLQYKPKNVAQDENIRLQSVDTPKNQLFMDLFAKQMKNYQKTSTDDELKIYFTESVVDPELLVKENTGIDQRRRCLFDSTRAHCTHHPW